MVLMELIGELMNPGKIGTVNITKNKKEKRMCVLIVKSIVSIIIITIIYYLNFNVSFHIKDILLFIAAMVVYSSIGYFILPKPDYTNVGWLGGILNNPFRISDNVNRLLVFVMVLLIPGRLISTTILSWVDLFKNKGDSNNIDLNT